MSISALGAGAPHCVEQDLQIWTAVPMKNQLLDRADKNRRGPNSVILFSPEFNHTCINILSFTFLRHWIVEWFVLDCARILRERRERNNESNERKEKGKREMSVRYSIFVFESDFPFH